MRSRKDSNAQTPVCKRVTKNEPSPDTLDGDGIYQELGSFLSFNKMKLFCLNQFRVYVRQIEDHLEILEKMVGV